MILLDTDTMTHLHAGHTGIIERLRTLDDPEIGITIITKIELLQGRFDFLLKAANGSELIKAQHQLTVTETLLKLLLIIPIDERSAAQFYCLRMQPSLRKIGRADLLIAGMTLAHQATLISRNLRHFSQIPQLKVANWID